MADQKAVLEERRDAACAELRESRDQRYRELLDDQRTVRADLRSRQDAGLDNTQFLEQVKTANIVEDRTAEFRAASDEAVSTPGKFRAAGDEPVSTRGMAAPESDAQSGTRPRANVDGMRLRAGFNFAGLFDSLFTHLANGGSPPQPPPRADPDLLRAAADETAKRQQHEREQSDEDWRERHRSYGNNRGTEPATPVSRENKANEKAIENERPIAFAPCSETKSAEEKTEWKRRDTPWIGPAPAEEDDDGAQAALRTMFRQKIADLRRLPRHQRAAALWAAKLWLAIELKALREKRACERQGRYMQWRLQNPAPR